MKNSKNQFNNYRAYAFGSPLKACGEHVVRPCSPPGAPVETAESVRGGACPPMPSFLVSKAIKNACNITVWLDNAGRCRQAGRVRLTHPNPLFAKERVIYSLPKPSVPARKIFVSGHQLFFPEIRPKGFRKIKLTVRGQPHHEPG